MANGVETTAGKPDPREQFEIAAEGLSRAEIESRAYHRTLEQNLYAYGPCTTQYSSTFR